MHASLAIRDAVSPDREALLDALSGLDGLLERALELAPSVYGWEPGNVRFRGLYISTADAQLGLRRPPVAPLLEDSDARFHALDFPSMAALAERYELDWFDCAILLIAMAPELAVGYERAYAFLQDDVARRHPSVDLILNLLCRSASEKLECRSRFTAGSALRRARLIHLFPESSHIEPSLIAQWVKADEQAVRAILQGVELDSRLTACAELGRSNLSLSTLPIESAQAQGLRNVAFRDRAESVPLRLFFRGPSMPLKRRTAEALAGELNRWLLAVDPAIEPAKTVAIAVREAWLSNAILFLDLGRTTPETAPLLLAALEDALRMTPADVILAGPDPGVLAGLEFFSVDFALPSYETLCQLWRTHCDSSGIHLDQAQLDSLAERFRLYPDQVETTVNEARQRARWRGEREPGFEDLAASARTQSSRQIESLARKIEPTHAWDEIVLPPATVGQLRALCSRVVHRHRVLDSWGFNRKLSNGKGATALFAGPSGTGKTMAAEIVARDLGLELYKIDLSGVVSKYIGETEKNLERIFRAAENANAILFFDEADSLFGKRSEVRDSHDRYANIEVSYLLQKMEMYDGVAILATNLRQNLDESFVRRLAFTVHFPFPDAAQRRLIWERIWPAETPRDEAIDFEALAVKFKLSGGNIKNVALAAAFLAAEDSGCVSMRHLLTAVEREFQKMGKPFTDEQLGRVPEARP